MELECLHCQYLSSSVLCGPDGTETARASSLMPFVNDIDDAHTAEDACCYIGSLCFPTFGAREKGVSESACMNEHI